MKFDDIDARMRVFETAHDHCVLPQVYIVARIDGRNFTRLTKTGDRFEAPFDDGFRDLMVTTTKHVMESGFRIVYGYSESDEISLLFHRNDDTFGRKERKILSVLAGEASAVFSLAHGAKACFDCRVCQLPTDQQVVDYFRWRQEDAHRNALNAHCYWLLRRQGKDARAATQVLRGQSVADKNELLFQHGTNFNELPSWQKRGFGVRSEMVGRLGHDPVRGVDVSCERRQLAVDLELPLGAQYDDYLAQRLAEANGSLG